MIGRTLCVALLAITWAAIGSSPSHADEPTRIRLLSYNIHHGEGTDGRLDLERIARVIRSAEPDIVALQEVDRGTQRSHRVDEPAELARLTGLKALFEPNIPFQGGDYGNAVLTRLPIRKHRNVPLPSHHDGEQRGVLVVDLTLHDGRTPLRVFATHLDFRPVDTERRDSVALIAKLVSEDPNRPSVLMGDLNTGPESQVLQDLAKTWKRSNAEPLPTFPAHQPTRQIDFILYRPADHWRVVEVRVLEEPVASDHRPILAVLERVVEPGAQEIPDGQ